MTIDEIAYADFKNKFLREYNRVECYRIRRKLTANVALREEYRSELTKTYNNITTFLHRSHLNGTFVEKLDCQNRQIHFKNKLREAFNFIRVDYEFAEQLFTLIDINKAVKNLQPNEIENEIEEENEPNNSEDNCSQQAKQTI